MRKIMFLIGFVVILFMVESFLESLSEIINYRYAPIEYRGYTEGSFFEYFNTFIISKLLFWGILYLVIYFYILKYPFVFKYGIINIAVFWLCVIISMLFFPDGISQILNLYDPVSIYSKWVQSSFIAILSGFIMSLLYKITNKINPFFNK